jgi:hypothetical protein
MKLYSAPNLMQNPIRNALIESVTDFPDSPGIGRFVFKTDSAYYYNGTAWVPFGMTNTEQSSILAFSQVLSKVANNVQLASSINTTAGNFSSNLTFSGTANQIVVDALSANQFGLKLADNIVIPGSITANAATFNDATINNILTVATVNATNINVTGTTSMNTVTSLVATMSSVVANSIDIEHVLTSTNGAQNSSTFKLKGTANQLAVSLSGADAVFALPTDLITPGSLTVTGNLTVNGTTTIVNSQEHNIADNIIRLNSNVTGLPTTDGGIEIERGSQPNVLIRWNETSDRWEFTNDGSTYNNFLLASDVAHPTQSAINTTGTGLQFIRSIAVNTLGHVTAATLDTIQTATDTQLGVIRLATVAENNAGSATDVAVTPAGMTAAITAGTFKASITTSGTITHNLNTKDVLVQFYDEITGEQVYINFTRTLNTLTVNFDVLPSNSIRVLIRKI